MKKKKKTERKKGKKKGRKGEIRHYRNNSQSRSFQYEPFRVYSLTQYDTNFKTKAVPCQTVAPINT